MRLQDTVSLLTAIAAIGVAAQEGPKTGAQGNATVVENNPPGVVYVATLPDTAFDKAAFPNGGNIKGGISAVASPSGIGVLFKVRFFGLPSGGPFTYHLHDAPVPENGNCTATLAHLDPFIRGEDPVCNSSLPQTCQVGDLSGKHGKITSDPFEATFHDDFASTLPGIGAFFGNRSFVLHYPNKTRITCANFKLTAGAEAPIPTPTENCNSTITPHPTGVGATLHPSPTFVTARAGTVSATLWAVGAAWLFTVITFML